MTIAIIVSGRYDLFWPDCLLLMNFSFNQQAVSVQYLMCWHSLIFQGGWCLDVIAVTGFLTRFIAVGKACVSSNFLALGVTQGLGVWSSLCHKEIKNYVLN